MTASCYAAKVEDDVGLYRRWASGDRDAGQQLVDRYFVLVARFFGNKVARRDDAEDLVSETFERCAKSLGRFRGDASFRAYLFGIAYNVLRDYVRRVARHDVVELETTSIRQLGRSPVTHITDKESEALLLEALRAIPLLSQVVLELSYFEGLGRSEIAGVLDVPPGTVASRLQRGHAQLEAKLTELAENPRQLHATASGLAAWVRSIRGAINDAGA